MATQIMDQQAQQVSSRSWTTRRDEKQRAHVYIATKPREWTQKQIAGDLLRRAFGGSARSLLMGALSARRASKDELDSIRQLLDEYEKENSK